MAELDIAEVARRSGVPASTLRYYEELGLIGSVGRRGLRRLFEPAVLERLAIIALGRASGFSLQEIGAFFAGGPDARIDKARLAAKADELGLATFRLPFEAPAPEIRMYWHSRHQKNPAHVWLRERVAEAAAGLN